MNKTYYVYILTNNSKTLYTSLTNDIKRRIYEHKNNFVQGFTSKYNIKKLVYFESTSDVKSGISRESKLRVG